MKKIILMAGVALAVASCGGGKADSAQSDSVVVKVDTLTYYQDQPTQIEGDRSVVEFTFLIPEGDSIAAYTKITTYTYGSNGQQARTGSKGKATITRGTKKDPAALLLTLNKDDSDEVIYFERAKDNKGNDIIIQLAEDKGRPKSWENYIYIRR